MFYGSSSWSHPSCLFADRRGRRAPGQGQAGSGPGQLAGGPAGRVGGHRARPEVGERGKFRVSGSPAIVAARFAWWYLRPTSFCRWSAVETIGHLVQVVLEGVRVHLRRHGSRGAGMTEPAHTSTRLSIRRVMCDVAPAWEARQLAVNQGRQEPPTNTRSYRRRGRLAMESTGNPGAHRR